MKKVFKWIKETIEFVYFLFYRYYSTGESSEMPRVYTAFAFVGVFILHLFHILLLFNKMNLLPMGKGYSKGQSYLNASFIVFPVFGIFYFILRKIDITKLDFSKEKIRKGNRLLILYIILSTILFFLIAIIKYS